MKKVILVTALFFSCFAASAQFTYKIKADSLLVTNDSCTAELNLENSTKYVPGFLWNKGRGRTEFKRVLQMVDSVTYLIGEDTLRVTAGSSADAWKLTGNAGTSANHFLGTTDSVDLIIKTKAIENGRFRATGGMVFKNAAGLDKIDISKNGTDYLSITHRFGQGENKYFTTPLTVVAVMDSAYKKGRGTLISATRDFKSADGVTVNPSTLDGNSILGHTNLRMKKGSYNFYSDATTGFPTSSILANMHIASQDGSDSVTRYTFYGTFGGATTGLSNVTARMDFSWAKPSDNYGMYNSYLSVPLFSGQVGRYTEWFNHYAAAFTYKGGANGKVGTVTGLYIENLKQDSVNRAWGILQLGVNDLNGFKGKVMIGDTTVANFGSNNLYVVGNGKFTDTLTATTMATTDSSDRVATTKWVKQQGFGSGSSGGNGNGWSLTGNAGTDPANNFLGTTDTQRLVFKTNNTEKATIDTMGRVGIGIAIPTEKLHVQNGRLRIDGTFNNSYGGAPIIVTDSSANSQNNVAYLTAPNLPDNSRLTMEFGRSSSLYNSGFMSFSKFVNGSVSNYVEFQIWGVANLLKIHANRNVEIGKTAIGLSADDGYRLNVLKSETGLTTEGRVINASTQGATFNTTSGALTSYGGYYNSNGTRSAGANNLTNIGLFATASGGQVNYALKTDGSVNMTNLPVSSDTSYKPLAINTSGDVVRRTNWAPDLSNAESFLTSDVALTANTFSDAVSVSLAAGTWLISGSATVESPNNTAHRVTYKVWDGTTVYQAGEASSNAMGSSIKGYVSVPVSSLVILTGTTTVKISIASTATSTIKATPADNNSGTTNMATSFRAVRIK